VPVTTVTAVCGEATLPPHSKIQPSDNCIEYISVKVEKRKKIIDGEGESRLLPGSVYCNHHDDASMIQNMKGSILLYIVMT
jgi:hypothetical protein